MGEGVEGQGGEGFRVSEDAWRWWGDEYRDEQGNIHRRKPKEVLARGRLDESAGDAGAGELALDDLPEDELFLPVQLNQCSFLRSLIEIAEGASEGSLKPEEGRKSRSSVTLAHIIA